MSNSDLFRGNNKALITSINALLALDAKGALLPNGIGEMARDLLETCAARLPAEQHQGEPVVLPACKSKLSMSHDWDTGHLDGWNACLDEIAKLGPLYPAPADPEPRGAFAKCMEAMADRDAAHKREDALRAQLAKCRAWIEAARDGVLYPIARDFEGVVGRNAEGLDQETPGLLDAIDAALSANAEPGAPKCTYCGDTGQIMVGRSGDANDGNAPIMEPCEDCDGSGSSGGQMHSNGVDAPEYEPFKCETCSGFGIVGNILNAETCTDCTPSTPIERDERAAFERAFVVQEGVFFSPERKEYRSMNGRTIEETDSIDLNLRLSGWLARAALECKPTALVAQLQADLTARDERIDTLVDDLEQAKYDWDAWKNEEESLWVQVFHGEGDDPFISAVNGAICIEELTLIQEEIVTGAEDLLESGPGFYVLRCRHHEAHYDNVGMTEPAHWEIDFESYSRFPWADEAEAMAAEANADYVDYPIHAHDKPCPGCGTPGYTGACEKCIPY